MRSRYSPSTHRLAILSSLVLSFAACERRTTDRDIIYLDPYEAISMINKPPGAFQSARTSAFVDPRSRVEYEKLHIAGAISLPFQDMTLEAKAVLEPYAVVIVYDTDYDDVIGKSATKRLLELGLKDVYTLEGGLKAWQKAGNEVQSGIPANAPELPDKPVT